MRPSRLRDANLLILLLLLLLLVVVVLVLLVLVLLRKLELLVEGLLLVKVVLW
jgi:hypothetical protein